MGKKKGVEREKQIQEWYEMYKAYQKSGKSVSEWCAEKRITEGSFYHKIRVLRKAGLDIGARGKTTAERADDYSNTDYGEAVEKQEIVSINDMSSERYCKLFPKRKRKAVQSGFNGAVNGNSRLWNKA